MRNSLARLLQDFVACQILYEFNSRKGIFGLKTGFTFSFIYNGVLPWYAYQVTRKQFFVILLHFILIPNIYQGV